MELKKRSKDYMKTKGADIQQEYIEIAVNDVFKKIL